VINARRKGLESGKIEQGIRHLTEGLNGLLFFFGFFFPRPLLLVLFARGGAGRMTSGAESVSKRGRHQEGGGGKKE
jgi:hypothetical protein